MLIDYFFSPKYISKKLNIYTQERKKRGDGYLKESGESKALWVIAIVLVIFLIGGIVILWGMGEVAEEAEEELRPAKVEMTILSAEKRKGFTANTYIQLQMKNVSEKKDASLNIFNFSIETNTGTKYDAIDMEEAPDKLAPGGEVTFRIGFEVKEAENPLVLHYEPAWAEESFKANVPELTEYKPEVSITVSEPADRLRSTSIKVSISGETASYEISLTGPDGTEVGSGYVTESEMSDGKQSIWVSMVSHTNIAAGPGTYTLLITDSFGNEVYDEEITYSGANLKVDNLDLEWKEWKEISMPTDLDSVIVTITNTGDLPGYVLGIDVSINGENDSSIPKPNVIPAGETRTIEAEYAWTSLEPGSYSATFELREGGWGEGEIVATYTKDITVP